MSSETLLQVSLVALTLTVYFNSCWLRRSDKGTSPVSTCSAEAAVLQKAPQAIRNALCW